MRIDAFCRCNTGLVRENNEDNFYLCGKYREDLNINDISYHKKTSDKCALFAVADGMGGESDGELASLLAVKSLFSCHFDEIKKCALCSFSNANLHICAEIEKQKGLRMGSTLVALYIDGGKGICCNIGDSHAYLLRDGRLVQLSTDDSRAAQLSKAGVITPEQAKNHPSKHELTQHLGIFEEEMMIEPHFSDSFSLQTGDIFLICSDGLTDMLDDVAVKEILSAGKNADEKSNALLLAALKNGGKDNITVIVMCVK